MVCYHFKCVENMILSGWAIPTCFKVLHEKVWDLQWDQNTPIKEVLSPMR